MPLALRISHTVDAATFMPSPASSPWILRYPQPGFSRASRRTSARMLRRVAGRPVLPRLDLAAQRRRTMSRCQRTIVSGVISSRSPWRRAFGITPSRVASRARSAQCNFSRRGCRRCSTASWWRRIKISAVFHISSRRDSRNPAATRVIRRNTNRRHMIGESNPAGQSRGRDSRHAQASVVTVGPVVQVSPAAPSAAPDLLVNAGRGPRERARGGSGRRRAVSVMRSGGPVP